MESYYYIFHPTKWGIYIYIQTQYHEIIIKKFETKGSTHTNQNPAISGLWCPEGHMHY